MHTEKEEHVIDAINAIRAKSKRPDSTSTLEYNNKNFATNAYEIYVNNVIQVLSDENKIRYKPTSKGSSYFIIEANNMTILDETQRMHDKPKDDTLNIDQSYNTSQIPLTDKTEEKHGDKVLNNSIDKIRSQLKTLKISIKEGLTLVENQMREKRNDSQPHAPVSINNRTNEIVHQPLVTDLLKLSITELEKQVADNNCIIEYLTKKRAK